MFNLRSNLTFPLLFLLTISSNIYAKQPTLLTGAMVIWTNAKSVNSTYSSETLNGSVTITPKVFKRTVPANGTYTIEVWGARGGASGSNYGKGARMKGDFTLSQGDVLKIVVGQMGGQQNLALEGEEPCSKTGNNALI